jgi:hypothetical protein
MTSEQKNGMALVTVRGDEAASLEGAAEQLGVALDDLDSNFGVVPIDPQEQLYAVNVRADRLPADFTASEEYRGPFSSPAIAPFSLDTDTPDKKTKYQK